MGPQVLHSITNSGRDRSSLSTKHLTYAANCAFQHQDYVCSDQGSSSPKSPLSFDLSETCVENDGKKRKMSISSMVDDIFAGTDESFFLQNPPSKIRRSLSRCKSYRSLVERSVSEEKQVQLEHGTSSTESIESKTAQNTERGSFYQASPRPGHESALNIYQKLFVSELPTTVSSLSLNGSSVSSTATGYMLASGKNNRESLSTNFASSNAISSKSDNDNEDTAHYGWFVQTDEEKDHEDSRSTSVTGTTVYDDLAFKATTAPKRVNDDAELEWACAADTVDDVLRDLF